ncbi:MAG TPA: hypothetical protein VEA19_02460 [Actinomycetota bacterium]|nr:hypothetical protein [Actinomycetota bacterium]
MAHQHGHVDDHTHGQPAAPADGGLTGYAIVKYGVILVITVLVLWFVANYFLGD